MVPAVKVNVVSGKCYIKCQIKREKILITSKRIVGVIVFSSSKTFLLADREDDIPLKYQREVSGV